MKLDVIASPNDEKFRRTMKLRLGTSLRKTLEEAKTAKFTGKYLKNTV